MPMPVKNIQSSLNSALLDVQRQHVSRTDASGISAWGSRRLAQDAAAEIGHHAVCRSAFASLHIECQMNRRTQARY